MPQMGFPQPTGPDQDQRLRLLHKRAVKETHHDGTVEQPPLSEQTPFAAVTNFVATYEEVIQNPAWFILNDRHINN